MRKIVAGLFISLDGVTESPDTWHFPYGSDEMWSAPAWSARTRCCSGG